MYFENNDDIKKRIIESDVKICVVGVGTIGLPLATFLAKKGLEVHEFRIESGLNCGGHAFASNGQLLPILLKELPLL